MFTLTHLTADTFTEPIGLGATPVLGWRLHSDAQGVRQTACRVQLSDAPDFAQPLFDSGELALDDSAHYRPDWALASNRRYYWRVWTRANPGAMEAWSEAASFVTGLMDAGEWQARFITAEGPDAAADDRATAVTTAFEVDGRVKAAYLHTTALGVYHCFLDGRKVGQDQLAPGWTSYRHRLLYQTYDVTALLTPGRHELAGWLGAGWYKGLIGFLLQRNNYGTRTAFCCQLEIEYEGGRRARVLSDESWKGWDTPVLFSGVYDGETFDARLGLHGERPVAALPVDLSTLTAQAGCRVRIAEELPARELITTPNGERVLDFGQNLTGFVRFTVRGEPGAQAELQCFETLDKDGNVYTANLRTAKQTLRYTLRGGGAESYQPLFTFQGFRYVHIKAWPGEPRPEDFTACVIHSDMRKTGSFRCSEPLLNQLWHNIEWGMKGNFVDIPSDCPQRDERMGWTGDAQIFSATACILMDTDAFFRKWLLDLAADQTPEGAVPHVVPDTVSLVCRDDEGIGAHGAAAWADAAVVIPWNLYLAYGDRDALAAQYRSMAQWIGFMEKRAKGCLWSYYNQFGDWVALDAAEGSYHGATPNELTCAAYYAYSCELMAKAAAVLGKADDAARYAALHGRIRASFIETFFTPEGELTAQTQTAHILALHFGLAPDPDKTLAGLLRLLDERDGHLCTGFVGTPYFTHALSDHGALDAAYALVLKKDYPSWLYQVSKGATTIWEHWDGIKPDGSMWSADMNSFNHYAYGAVGEWLFKAAGGIRPDENAPGYRHALLSPLPGGGLTQAEAALDTVYGRLAVAWRIEGDALVIEAEVPCNATATLRIPQVFGGGERELGSGRYVIRCKR